MTDIEFSSLLNGKLRLHQLQKGHRVGTDAVLLAAAAPSTQGVVVDAGAGVGAVGLILAWRFLKARVLLLDKEEVSLNLARRNICENQMQARVEEICVDLLSPTARRIAGLEDGQADLVVSNPPFFDPRHVRRSPDPLRAQAHVESLESGGLEGWITALNALLKPKGTCVLIQRADRLGDVLRACEGRWGGVQIRPIHPKIGRPAIRILLRGQKNSRAPLSIEPPLILHEEDGRFTPFVAALHRGEVFL